MSELQALIFDVDGTLADTERDGHRVAFNAAFEESGIDWHWSVDTYGELLAVTGGKERLRYFIDRFAGGEALSTAQRDSLDTLIPDLHRAKTRHYTALLGRGAIPLRTGVERLLREAREQGLRLAIATTTTPANVSALLENTLGRASLDWFDVIAAGDIVPAKKPAPDIYDFALREMGLAASQCLAFEDSRNGILSSHGAGLATVVTVNGYTIDHDFSNAALVLDHLGDSGTPCSVLAGRLDHTQLDIDALRGIHTQSRC